jgi:AcrR family transcriptional regulator
VTTAPPTAAAPADRAPGRPTRDGAATKRRIVDAAEAVVLRDGVGHLTLEAAAHEAGLSKGGVLYHFPSRDALVAAMVARIIDQFEEAIAAHLPPPGSPDHGRPGTFARAYVAASTAPAAEGEERLGAALLAAAAAEPVLLEPLREAAGSWQARLVGDGLDPATATVVRMACDGLWLCGLFGLAPPAGDLQAAVAASLVALTGGTS